GLVVACPDAAVPQGPTDDAKAIEGLWSGTWGGGERDGVEFQPVIAELMIEGDQAEFAGLPNLNRLRGTAHLDVVAKRMRITPTAGGPYTPPAIEYAYEIAGDKLTLTDGDNASISMRKLRVVQDPLAIARVELVAAGGINAAGDLLVTEFNVLWAARSGATHLQPEMRTRRTRHATILLVQETGLRNVTVDEARRLIRGPTPVVIAYRPADPLFPSTRPPPRRAEDLRGTAPAASSVPCGPARQAATTSSPCRPAPG